MDGEKMEEEGAVRAHAGDRTSLTVGGPRSALGPPPPCHSLPCVRLGWAVQATNERVRMV